jgi:hypothetical protein
MAQRTGPRDNIVVTSTTDSKADVEKALLGKAMEPNPEGGENEGADEGDGAADGEESEGADEGDAGEGGDDGDPGQQPDAAAARGRKLRHDYHKGKEAEGEEGDGAEGEGEGDGEGEASATGDDDKAEAKKPRRRRGGRASLEERIGYKDFLLNQERSRREEAEAELQRLKAGKSAGPAEEEAPKFDKAKPKLDDFETIEEWQDALIDWTEEKVNFNLDQRLAKERQGVVTPEQLRMQEAHRQHEARLAAYRDSHPEFVEAAQAAIDEGLPWTPLMQNYAMDSELGPAVMHYLAENPDRCRAIAEMTAGRALVALGRVEAEVEKSSGSGKAANGEGKSRTATPPRELGKRSNNNNGRPPEPPKPVGQRGNTAPKNPSDMSFSEYREWRRRSGAR